MNDRTKLSVLFVVLCTLGLVSSWSYVMVDDEHMVGTTDVILEGTVMSYGPSTYADMPATDYQVRKGKFSREN